jgi:hypothetical protein
VGKWEQIEREAREDELKELERELHGEQQRGREAKPRRQQQRKTEPGVPDAGTARADNPDSTGSDA